MYKILFYTIFLTTNQARTIQPKKYRNNHETNPTNYHQAQHGQHTIQINASDLLKSNKCYTNEHKQNDYLISNYFITFFPMNKNPESFPDEKEFTTIFNHPKLDTLLDIIIIFSIICTIIAAQKTCCIDLLVLYLKVKILKLPKLNP